MKLRKKTIKIISFWQLAFIRVLAIALYYLFIGSVAHCNRRLDYHHFAEGSNLINIPTWNGTKMKLKFPTNFQKKT
jgi:hypothetical protein